MKTPFKFCFCLADSLYILSYLLLFHYYYTAWLVVQRMTKPFRLVNLFIVFLGRLLYSQDLPNFRTCLHSCLKADDYDELFLKFNFLYQARVHLSLESLPFYAYFFFLCEFCQLTPATWWRLLLVESGDKCQNSHRKNTLQMFAGIYREIGVRGFQIYGDCMYTRNPCNFQISTLWFPL